MSESIFFLKGRDEGLKELNASSDLVSARKILTPTTKNFFQVKKKNQKNKSMKTQWLQTTSVVHWPSTEENIIYTAMEQNTVSHYFTIS